MGIKDFFRRPGPEGGTQPEHHDERLPFPEDLPHELKVVVDGQEITGHKAPDIWSNLHEDSDIPVILPDGSTKEFKYGDILNWNEGNIKQKESDMAGEGIDPGAPEQGDERRQVDTISATTKAEGSSSLPQYVEGVGYTYEDGAKPVSEVEPSTVTAPAAEADKTLTKELPAEPVVEDNPDHDKQPEAASWNYKIGKKDEWDKSQTEQGQEKVNPLDSIRRNIDIVNGGEGILNKLGVKNREHGEIDGEEVRGGWELVTDLGELMDKIASGEIKDLPDNYSDLKEAVKDLRDRLQAELFRDESERYETSNDRLATNPEAEKILAALNELMGLLNRFETERERGIGDPTTVPPVVPPVKPPEGPKPPEKLSVTEALPEPQELIDIRRVYTEMLIKNESMVWTKRPKTDQEVTIENNYHKLLQEYILAWAENEVSRLQPELEGAEKEARMLELATQKHSKEDRALAEVGVELYQESRYKKATDWLKKHPKLRLAVGAALTAGTITTAALGLWPATAAFSVAKGTLAGATTAGGVEGGWDWLQNRSEAKKGTSAIYTNEEIQAMSQEEVMRYMSGNLARSLERGTSFDDDPQRKATIEALEAKRTEGLNAKYQELLQKGMKPEQVVAAIMSEELKQEHLNHMAETKRRGNEAAAKRATALVSGAAVGILTGLLPFHHPAAGLAARPGAETGQTAEGFKDYIATKPEGVSLRSFAIRTARQISQKTGAHYSPNQQKTLAEGLYDMWQGPGNGVRGAGALLNKTSVRLPVDESMIRAAFRFPRTKF
jgi:hypothetical protein